MTLIKRLASVLLILAVLVGVMTGCGKEEEKTPEQLEIERLEAIAAEEASTGLKKLDSPNLMPYELPLANFVKGVKAEDAALICDAVDSPKVMSDESVYGWALENGYEFLQQYELDQLRVKTSQQDANATLVLYAPDDDTSSDTDGVSFECVYEGGRWVLKPMRGVLENFTFTSSLQSVSCGGESLAEYATTFNGGKSWSFTIPHIVEMDNYNNLTVTSEIGDFSAMLYSPQNGYSRTRELLTIFSDEQKEEIETAATDAITKVFLMLQAGTSKNELAEVILSEQMVSEMFPSDEEDKAALEEVWQGMIGVTLQPGTPSGGYPDDYVYRLIGNNTCEMDAKVLVSTTAGESRKLATITLQKTNDKWKILNLECKDGSNLFVDLSVFDPQW